MVPNHNKIPRWNLPVGDLALTAQDVHVWRIYLDMPLIQEFHDILLPEERARAQRFYFEKDRHRWTVAHAILRILLGHYTHADPRSILLDTNAYGKPALASPRQTPPLQFNLSHSASYGLCAFSWQRELGVDLEYMRSGISYDELARHSFSPVEQNVLLALPQEEKHLAFYQCWTRKEAYIKARGMGLSLPLDLFDVSLLPGEPAALLGSREDPAEVQRWSMQELAPGPDYVGALMVEGHKWELQCWQWTESALEKFLHE